MPRGVGVGGYAVSAERRDEMSKQWQPVEDGTYKSGSSWGGDINARSQGSVLGISAGAIKLPDNLRLCELVEVEPEAITPEALEREGWAVSKTGIAEFVIDEDTSVKVRVWADGDVWIYECGESVSLPNCKTIPQLRALVEMLGGAQ